MKIAVTGGAGFIGSAVIRRLIKDNHAVINIDKLTYAGNLDSLGDAVHSSSYVFCKEDICNESKMLAILTEHSPDAILHLAAESHVDNSIEGPAEFIQTNLVGTFALLQASLKFWRGLSAERQKLFRFHHVSTDEVFGSIEQGLFTEETRYQPNSPYSASKAGSDHLVRAWHETYKLPIIMTNCSNNYGPYQYPEKFIPVMILNAIGGRRLPVYGDGLNIRDWLFVNDHVDALLLVLSRGRVGESYNIGANCQKRNIDVAHTICDIVDELKPDPKIKSRRSLIELVKDRPGHDRRYAIDATKITRELSFKAKESFETGLRKTIEWYLNNNAWVERVSSGKHRSQKSS